jgi:hypothetical protein
MGVGLPPIRGYIASLIIEYPVPSAKAGGRASLADYAPSGLEVRKLEGAESQYAVTFVSPDRQEALASLDDLAGQLIANVGTTPAGPDPKAVERASARVAAAKEAADRAADEWAKWKDRRAAAEAAARNTAKERQPAEQFGPTPVAPAPPAANPRWAELTQFLERLRAQRMTLLIDRTEAHPAVIDVGLRIAEVERQLAVTEQYLPGASSDTTSIPQGAPAPVVQTPMGDGGPRAPPVEMPDPLEGERLRRAWELAQRELAAAEVAYREAQVTEPVSPQPRARIIRAGELAGVTGGEWELQELGLLLIASAVAGLVVARLASAPQAPGVFTSVEEISRILQTPVVAALSTGDGPRIPTVWAWRIGLGRTLVRSAEVVVVAVVIVALAVAAYDPLVARVAMTHPLQAISLLVECAR